MEVIPVVTQILYYTIALLVLALITNFLIYKFKKEPVQQAANIQIRKLSEEELINKANLKKDIRKRKEELKADKPEPKVEDESNPLHFKKRLDDYEKPTPKYVVRKRKVSNVPKKKVEPAYVYEDSSSASQNTSSLDFRNEFR